MEKNSDHNKSQSDNKNRCDPRSEHGRTSIQCCQSTWSAYRRFVEKMSTKNADIFLVSYFKDVNGKKIANFDDVPVFKDPTEMSLNVLEVHYKFSKFPKAFLNWCFLGGALSQSKPRNNSKFRKYKNKISSGTWRRETSQPAGEKSAR